MLSTDTLKASWKSWIDALEADTRLVAHDRAILTAYKTALDTNTTYMMDQQVLEIHKKLFAKAGVGHI
jgi:hypothetical protein